MTFSELLLLDSNLRFLLSIMKLFGEFSVESGKNTLPSPHMWYLRQGDMRVRESKPASASPHPSPTLSFRSPLPPLGKRKLVSVSRVHTKWLAGGGRVDRPAPIYQILECCVAWWDKTSERPRFQTGLTLQHQAWVDIIWVKLNWQHESWMFGHSKKKIRKSDVNQRISR